MSLQYIIGGSGSGKSRYAFEKLIRESLAEPQKLFYVIVPEQFTMQTQKTLTDLHPGGGILNIDILSFQRLAHRIFEEVGGDTRRMLEDTGKSLVLEKLRQDLGSELPYLGTQLARPGTIDEVKSLISEFMQYSVSVEELSGVLSQTPTDTLLGRKLRDLTRLYASFRAYLKEHYLTAEEMLEVLLPLLALSENLRGSTMLFDGFTGFTPIQLRVIRELLSICSRIRVTVTLDPSQLRAGSLTGKNTTGHGLFAMSYEMMAGLNTLTRDIEDPVIRTQRGEGRFANAPSLHFIEQNLFRYNGRTYGEVPREVCIFSEPSPLAEVRVIAARIHRLVRGGGVRYGEIAVITGDLEEYGELAARVFEEAGLPYFLDRKHTVRMNPLVEMLRAVMEIFTGNFAYESVFRYLRSGMSDLSRELTDKMDNYCLALGIRGKKAWNTRWVRLYRGMDPGQIDVLEEGRKALAAELSPFEEIVKGKHSIREHCTVLFGFLQHIHACEKIRRQESFFREKGDKALEKEASQIYEMILDLLDKLVDILGEEPVTFQDFAGLMETGLSKLQIGMIPPGQDQILIGDMERSRLKGIKALFFAGVNEGNIPKVPPAGGFLTEMDREYFAQQGIELAPGTRQLLANGRFYLYLNLTKPSRLLCLSYAHTSSRGEALRPAYLIGNIKELFPKLSEEHEAVYIPGMAERSAGVEQGDEAVYIPDAAEMPAGAGQGKDNGSGYPLEAGVESASDPGAGGFLADDAGNRIPELPGSGLSVITACIRAGGEALQDPLFRELYRWYAASDGYSPSLRLIRDAVYFTRPDDLLGRKVAQALYGEISPYSATRLERYCGCAYAHFLQYGLRLADRQTYEFQAADLGNVMHQSLERFSLELGRRDLRWADLEDGPRDALVDECVDIVTADYGNTILHSTARNGYMISRIRRILRRCVWALQQQLRSGTFIPENFELAFEGGRIDRVDVDPSGEEVFVKVIDYKTGSTSFDLNRVYHGLQLQLMIYLDAAIRSEQDRFPGRRVVPAGIFYFNIKDPVIDHEMVPVPLSAEEMAGENAAPGMAGKIAGDVAPGVAGKMVGEDAAPGAAEEPGGAPPSDPQIREQILKELKMNGLVNADEDVVRRLDETTLSLPVALNKDGTLRKGSSVADPVQFGLLGQYVKKKIDGSIRQIYEGDALIAPYEMGERKACDWCAFASVCGFDRRIPGFVPRRLENLSRDEIWERLRQQDKV